MSNCIHFENEFVCLQKTQLLSNVNNQSPNLIVAINTNKKCHNRFVGIPEIELEFLGNFLQIIRLHSKYWVSMQQNVLNWILWLSLISKLIFAVLKKPRITWNFWHGLGSTYLDGLCPKHKKRPSKGQKRTITKFFLELTLPFLPYFIEAVISYFA